MYFLFQIYEISSKRAQAMLLKNTVENATDVACDVFLVVIIELRSNNEALSDWAASGFVIISPLCLPCKRGRVIAAPFCFLPPQFEQKF